MKHKTWESFLDEERQKPYYAQGLKPFVEAEYAAYTVYPEHKKILRALALTPLDQVKVCILGQDPYHEQGQAHGLAFSVPDGVPIPPSLKNIYAEIDAELGCGIPRSGNLTSWAEQGVLLLNTVLTVRAHEANSHAGHGWETFTDAVVRTVAEEARHPVVFMLWGSAAAKKLETALRGYPDADRHLYLTTSHPSPLSVYRGFRGCGHFKTCNEFLKNSGLEPVDWANIISSCTGG